MLADIFGQDRVDTYIGFAYSGSCISAIIMCRVSIIRIWEIATHASADPSLVNSYGHKVSCRRVNAGCCATEEVERYLRARHGLIHDRFVDIKSSPTYVSPEPSLAE